MARRSTHGGPVHTQKRNVRRGGETHGKWIDISVPLRTGMVHWPSDPPVEIELTRAIERGDSSNLSFMSMGSHSGTHMDAPVHFIRGGRGIDEMPVEATIGRARVIEIRDRESIKPGELEAHRIRRGERVLFRTRNSEATWGGEPFAEDFVSISKDAARFLASRGVRLVGVDYLSVGGYEREGPETHRALLEAGVWIIEGLDLSQTRQGRYDLICLPLRLAGGDGAPARAVLRPVR